MIFFIILVAYFLCPKHLKAVVFLANLFIPDEMPLVDEAIMLAMLLKGQN